MSHERLEIIRLNPTGDAKRQIVCLTGRVSVFRARLEEELAMYADMLYGKPTAERFSVLLDGLAFTPAEHLFIGFEEAPLAGEKRTIRQYLAEQNFLERDIEPQLLAHGLGGLSQAPCSELNSVQQRMLLFIVALSRSDKVLVLNDPFHELAEQWREKFAQRLAEHAWKNRVIVVVVRLSARPDVWIDNEYISRIQLEKPRERTIGFGGGDLSSADFVEQLREELKKTAPTPAAASAATAPKGQVVRRAEKPPPSLTAVVKPKPLLWQKPAQHAALAAAGVLMAIVLMISLGGRTEPVPPQPVRTAEVKPPAPDVAAVSSAAPAPVITEQAVKPIVVAARQDRPILNEYPPEIKEAVLKSFREPKSVLQNLPSFKPKPPEQPAPERITHSELPPPPPPVVPETAPLYEPNTIIRPETENEEELEAQRQRLRQHFLEAVARARERQMRENGLLPE